MVIFYLLLFLAYMIMIILNGVCPYLVHCTIRKSLVNCVYLHHLTPLHS
uniref:Uncharacterized protein n=2 Tax=Anguilla anguilla TaxID=7936 RepID=A0A0E9QJ08_ANGAN